MKIRDEANNAKLGDKIIIRLLSDWREVREANYWDFSNNALTSAMLPMMAKVVDQSAGIDYLNLSDNNLMQQKSIFNPIQKNLGLLADAFSKKPYLKTLILKNCGLNDESIKRFFHDDTNRRSVLEKLDLSDNPGIQSTESVKILEGLIKRTPTLQELLLERTGLSLSDQNQLKAACESNKSLGIAVSQLPDQLPVLHEHSFIIEVRREMNIVLVQKNDTLPVHHWWKVQMNWLLNHHPVLVILENKERVQSAMGEWLQNFDQIHEAPGIHFAELCWTAEWIVFHRQLCHLIDAWQDQNQREGSQLQIVNQRGVKYRASFFKKNLEVKLDRHVTGQNALASGFVERNPGDIVLYLNRTSGLISTALSAGEVAAQVIKPFASKLVPIFKAVAVALALGDWIENKLSGKILNLLREDRQHNISMHLGSGSDKDAIIKSLSMLAWYVYEDQILLLDDENTIIFVHAIYQNIADFLEYSIMPTQARYVGTDEQPLMKEVNPFFDLLVGWLAFGGARPPQKLKTRWGEDVTTHDLLTKAGIYCELVTPEGARIINADSIFEDATDKKKTSRTEGKRFGYRKGTWLEVSALKNQFLYKDNATIHKESKPKIICKMQTKDLDGVSLSKTTYLKALLMPAIPTLATVDKRLMALEEQQNRSIQEKVIEKKLKYNLIKTQKQKKVRYYQPQPQPQHPQLRITISKLMTHRSSS